MGDTSRLPSIDDFANSEQCVLEDKSVDMARASGQRTDDDRARTLRHDIEISDRPRGRSTRVRIYAEGLADIEIERRGRDTEHARIDLKFLDTVPETERHQATGLFKTAGLIGGLSGFLAVAGIFGWLPQSFLLGGFAGFGLTAATMLTGVFRSYEIITFKTLHGRADAIRLRAGLGTIGRFHVLMPKLSEAIAEAAESVLDETAVYLRAEMREHYRLRGDGVLTDEECAASTGKILNDFKSPA